MSSEGFRHVPSSVRFRDIDDFNTKYKGMLVPSSQRYSASPNPIFVNNTSLNTYASPADLSKLMGMLYVKELQRRLDEEAVPILVMAVHPGFVNSGAHMHVRRLPKTVLMATADGVQAYARSAGIFSPLLSLVAKVLFVSPSRGAYSAVFAAVAPVVREEPAQYAGAYIIPPGKIGLSTALVDDPQLSNELWDTTEQILQRLDI